MKLTILILFTLTMSLQANDWTGWSEERFFPTEKRISYRSRCNNSPNEGKHEWQVKFKNLTFSKLTFSLGIGADSSVKLNKQMDLGAGKEDWNWELLELASTSQAWVSVNVGGATTDNKNNAISKEKEATQKPLEVPKTNNLPSSGSWSGPQGFLTWQDAINRCESLGMQSKS